MNNPSTKMGKLFHIPGYIVLMIAVTVIGIGMSMTRPYLPLFTTKVDGMSPAQLGVLLSINAVGSVVASTWIGRLSDGRFARKDLITVASISGVFGYASFLFIHNYWVLLIVSTILLGVSSSAFPQIFAYAKESADRHAPDSTFAISTLRSFFSLAWVVGPMLGAWTLHGNDFQWMFWGTVCSFSIILWLSIQFLRRDVSSQGEPTTVHPQDHPNTDVETANRESRRVQQRVPDPIRRPHLVISVIAFTASSMASTIYGMNIPLFVTKDLNGTSQDVGFIFSLSAGLEIPIMIALGALTHRVAKKTMLIVGVCCGMVYYTALGFVNATWQILCVQVLCAIFIGIFVSIGMSYFQDFMPDSAGTATTLYSNTSNMGQLFGSLMGGGIAQLIGFRSVFWACLGMIIITLACLSIGPRKSLQQDADSGLSAL